MKLTRVIGVVLAILLASCETYKPPTLPRDQTATVVPPAKRWGNMLFIDQVDGLAPSKSSAAQLVLYSRPVVLAPGKHTMRVRVRLGMSEGLADIWLVAEAGKTYRIMKESRGNRFKVWFEDDATGIPVGGVGGSDDEPRNDSH